MKTIWNVVGGASCLVPIFLICLFGEPSYAEELPPIDGMGKGMWEPCPAMIPPPMPTFVEKMVGMPKAEHPHWLYFRNLNLDDRQKEALREIENNTLKELIERRADEQIVEIELRELLENETIDLKAVEAKLEQIAIIKSRTQLLVIKSTEQMKAKLTPEQRDKLRMARQVNLRKRPPREKEEMLDGMQILPPPY
jgi:Spy/CpxP family protein refolding chaperone